MILLIDHLGVAHSRGKFDGPQVETASCNKVREHIMAKDSVVTAEQMRNRIFGGARLCLDSMSKSELEAIQPLLLSNEAEVINEACRPYVVRKLPKW